MANLNIYSFNVRGLRDKTKRKIIFHHLKKKYPGGIYLLQETHSCDNDEDTWKREWKGDDICGRGGDIYFAHGRTDSCGVMIMFSADIDVDVNFVKNDDEGRILLLNLVTSDREEYAICNVYAPTRNKVNEQLAFLDNVKSTIASLDPLNLIMGGDYNTVFDPTLDKQGGDLSNCINKYTEELLAFMEAHDLVDAIRTVYQEKKIFTRTQRKPPVLSRIDHWLISSHLLNYLERTRVHPGLKSDHSIISLNISHTNLQRGRGFWKFNASLLRDIDYVTNVTNMINRLKVETENTIDLQMRWDYIKTEVRGYSVQYSSHKNRERKKFKAKLESDLKSAEEELQTEMSTEKLEIYHSLKEDLEKVIEMETKGAILCSRVEWAEAGEKNTKYFLNLEKKNAVDKHVYRLEMPDGTVSSDDKLILAEQKRFYEDLYSDRGVDKDLWKEALKEFTADGLTSLSDAKKDKCEGLITEKELSDCLKDMKRGKSPGCDGFTIEFYQFFWQHIKDLVIGSINYGYSNGELSVDQKRGIITLIPKKGKIRTLLKNWRPISLLNTDYKLLTKCLAMRLHHVLPSIINCDQTGFLKGRYIGENIRTIADIIEYTSIRNEPGIILLLDFEKAFDTIKWSFLIESLRFFNFGPSFISWVKTIYANTESTVINNGNTAGFFKLQRGIRQGCPLSPYLFIIAVEIMANAIRNNKSIKGIMVGKTEFKISQLADDTTIFVSDFDSIGNVLDLVSKFHKVSGLKLNVDKTVAKLIGSLEHCTHDSPFNLKWTDKPVCTLGITVSNDPDVIMKENFMPRLKAFDNILNIWYCRGLSLKGKVTILKSLALPNLLYPMSVLPIPTEIVNIIDNMIMDFIWNKRRPKVKKNVMIQNIENGGIKVPCFATMVEANRISWIKRILSDSDAKWKFILEYQVKPYSLLHFTECNLDTNAIDSIGIEFYCQIYNLWNRVKDPPSNASEFLEQVLWNNKYIKMPVAPKSKKMQSIKWPELYRAGIVKVKDLLLPDGTFIDLFTFCVDRNVKCNFISIVKMRKAIPIEWKTEILASNQRRDVVSNLVIKSTQHSISICSASTKSIAKKIYDQLILRLYVQPTAVNRWTEDFPINNEDWPLIFKLPYIATRDTYLQSLQFKFIHRIISCKKWLFTQKVIDSPYCNSCPDEVDDLIHHFVDCKGLNNFWNSLESWWNRTGNYQVKITNKHIIFGFYYDIYSFSSINFVILLAKSYIYRQVYLEHTVDFYNFLPLLKSKLEIEKSICISSGRSQSFDDKWSLIIDNL